MATATNSSNKNVEDESKNSSSIKRFRDETDSDSQNKFAKSDLSKTIQSSESRSSSGKSRNRYSASLRVPFWKEINRRRTSNEINTTFSAYFSLLTDKNGKEIFDDDRYLRVYKYSMADQKVNLDLKAAATNWTSDDQGKSIQPLLDWLSKHKSEFFHDDHFTFDLLSWRGVLREIMMSCFEKHNDWMLAVVKFKKAYFICEYSTESSIKKNENSSAEERLFCNYGYVFEELVTENLRSDQNYDAKKQISGVFQSILGNCRLFYGAEIDCIDDRNSPKPENIELKVTAGNSIEDLPFQHNRKFAKWWLQSYLAGIQKIVVGFRDKNGVVSRLSPLELRRIEREATTWTRQAFFNFFDMFVDFLKTQVIDEYSIENKDVILFRHLLNESVIVAERSSDPKYHFIPDSFYNSFV